MASPDSVGHRCLARGLSDIAAMGGTPHAAFLSLAVPADLPQRWVDDFISGLLKLAKQYSVTLAGGDTAQSPDGILADIIVLGSVPKGKAILRSGARPGDSSTSLEPSASPSPPSTNSAAARSSSPPPIRATSIPTRESPSANTFATRNSPPP